MLQSASTLLLLNFLSFASADLCQDNFTLSEVPAGIVAQAISLFTEGVIDGFFGCKNYANVSEKDVKFWLYTRANPDVPVLLNEDGPKQMDPHKKTIVLVHGWLCNITNERIPELKNAYLERYDAQIVAVDWSSKSIDLYTNSYCSVPKIGQILGQFLCASPNIDIAKLHLVGHSLGAHLSGFAGQEVQTRCGKKFARITGLDPAGPIYQKVRETARLNAKDAEMVDVIHTSMGTTGYTGAIGTVDFFPNCGGLQPGCLTKGSRTLIKDAIVYAAAITSCNHLRSTDYMVQSIYSNKYTSQRCKMCGKIPKWCIRKKIFGSTASMGEDCSSQAKGKFMLKLKSFDTFK